MWLLFAVEAGRVFFVAVEAFFLLLRLFAVETESFLHEIEKQRKSPFFLF